MSRVIEPGADDGLGRLCSAGDDVVFAAPSYPGIERIEARFAGDAYSRHRHDAYAIGVTMQGVQSFWYRGERRASLPGQIIILHPDEEHDGGAGNELGLLYRMLYIEPILLQESLGLAGGLPFVANPVVDDPALRRALMAVLDDLEADIEPLGADQFSAELADGLLRQAGGPARRAMLLDVPALKRARDYLDEAEGELVRSEALEAVSGLDRFTLARQFRSYCGTSPHRYLIMRRMDRGRRLLVSGAAIADVAAATGFADQSHFHRHFRKAFGVTPGRWQKLAARRE
ncbi:AraC family transcriptional regulator [Devosia epidermidihirudinis]|uniref:AraC family transcriptional regulator n=1 Tax=Devosia epidermidihirudinis TaxID=1293439 RepID=A0A0F5Q4V8_9HYPH|nr:AraC family transcriptional regulator [Devosia epidermidihirudinis]KKC35651.1 AraC family transcriptional regulator [Devosia epidermidihirudinis]